MRFQPFTTASLPFAPLTGDLEGEVFLRRTSQGIVLGNASLERAYTIEKGRLRSGAVGSRRVDGEPAV